MGVYSDYLDRFSTGNFNDLAAERKLQLRRISQIRQRDVLVFAADINKGNAQISIDYSDLVPFSDQLSNLKGGKLDLVLETPGGSGEVAEDLVNAMRDQFEDVGVIIPGYAKSAGTIITMAADEILMGPYSALGPIDAQIFHHGKQFSADAVLEGMEKIKEEVTKTGVLNRAYIPILQGISPGELQSAENALSFAKTLVTQWLAQYKFRTWHVHSSNQLPVTDDDKQHRAETVADRLCDHGFWKTHGRSIKIKDLEAMRLKITDYSKTPDLADAIVRYFTLLQMTFATNIYKLFETTDSQIMRFVVPNVPFGQQQAIPIPTPAQLDKIFLDYECPKCKARGKIQANFVSGAPIEPGCIPFPTNNVFQCPSCGVQQNLVDLRRQIEAQFKKSIV